MEKICDKWDMYLHTCSISIVVKVAVVLQHGSFNKLCNFADHAMKTLQYIKQPTLEYNLDFESIIVNCESGFLSTAQKHFQSKVGSSQPVSRSTTRYTQ